MAVVDPNGGFAGAPDGPYVDGFAVTPSDTQDFAFICNALRTATAQTTLAVVTQKGTLLNIGPTAAGETIRIRCKRINATGTSPGTGIIALI